MKSAFELALERSGGRLAQVSDEKKEAINQIDLKCKAKLAEVELSAEKRLEKYRDDPEKLQELKEGLLNELASIRERAERDKEAVRQS